MRVQTRPDPGVAVRTGMAGWVYRGVLPSHPATRTDIPRAKDPAERAPEAPSGGWSGWDPAASPSVRHPPCGPGQTPAGSSLVPPRAKAASWPIKARIQSYFSKVSQNHRVSPKYVQKACHSPYFQNGRQKSPLDILGFPFRPAFSPKELMGHFDRGLGFIVKMTKCRSYVHPCARERVAQIPPLVTAASCLL